MTQVGSSFVSVSARSLVSLTGSDADCTVVWMGGEHDSSNVDELVETLGRAIALDDADLVVDLSGVEFMGAATVNALLRADECLRQRSRRLTLRSPSRRALRVIELCGLAALLSHQPA